MLSKKLETLSNARPRHHEVLTRDHSAMAVTRFGPCWYDGGMEESKSRYHRRAVRMLFQTLAVPSETTVTPPEKSGRRFHFSLRAAAQIGWT